MTQSEGCDCKSQLWHKVRVYYDCEIHPWQSESVMTYSERQAWNMEWYCNTEWLSVSQLCNTGLESVIQHRVSLLCNTLWESVFLTLCHNCFSQNKRQYQTQERCDPTTKQCGHKILTNQTKLSVPVWNWNYMHYVHCNYPWPYKTYIFTSSRV